MGLKPRRFRSNINELLPLQQEERNLKIKLKMFVLELARSGTVKGFRFFAMYLRGKEELIVSVLNEPMVGNIWILWHQTPHFEVLQLEAIQLVIPSPDLQII